MSGRRETDIDLPTVRHPSDFADKELRKKRSQKKKTAGSQLVPKSTETTSAKVADALVKKHGKSVASSAAPKKSLKMESTSKKHPAERSDVGPEAKRQKPDDEENPSLFDFGYDGPDLLANDEVKCTELFRKMAGCDSILPPTVDLLQQGRLSRLAKGSIRMARTTCLLVKGYEDVLDQERGQNDQLQEEVESLKLERSSLLQRLKIVEDQLQDADSVSEEAVRLAKEEVTLSAQSKLDAARKYFEEKEKAFSVTSGYGQARAVSETLRTLLTRGTPISLGLVERAEKKTSAKKVEAEQCVVSNIDPNIFNMNSSEE